MDIICARTGRHFSNVEDARRCSSEHDHCNTCSYNKEYRRSTIHFILKGVDTTTQQDIDKLMIDINIHLKNKRTKLPAKRYHDLQPKAKQDENLLGDIHSKGKYSGQSTVVAWIAVGTIVFVIGLLVIIGWIR